MSFPPNPNAFDLETNINGGRLVTFVFTAGTSGAAPSAMTRGGQYLDATTPITKSTNDYVFNLKGPWYAMAPIGMAQVKQASFAASGACYGSVQADSSNSTTAPTFTVSFYKGSDGTAVALAAGDVVTLTVELTNTKYGAQ